MGKGANTNALDPLEVLIEGRLYDVSNFKHPGGSVIKYLTNGGDATEAFIEFHNRSKKASMVLKSLPSRPAPAEVMKTRGNNGLPALTKDYLALRKELEEEGFFKPAPFHVFLRFFEIFAMHIVGVYLFVNSDSLALKGLALLILGVISGRCGWLMHEGGHYSLTGHIPTDRFLQIALYGIGCGMSAAWWRNQHNKHHATPQKLKHDVDLDTLPLVAFNAAIADKVKSPLAKWWIRHQTFLFTPVSCLLVALGWQYYLHPRHIIRTKRLHTEGLALVIRHLLFYGVLCSGCTWQQSFVAYLIYNGIASSYIFTHFAMSHTHLPVSKPDEYLHWVEYGSKHTTNVGPNIAVNWIMGYLNFQIEHHLFPGMPQFRFPIVSKRVRKLFEKHGLQYDERPYFPCLYDTWANLHHVAESVDQKKKD